MEKFKRHFGLAVLVSELGHVFCCVLPTIFTVLSFAANLGLITMAPSWVLDIHKVIHHYELPIIIFSGVILVLGWVAYRLSNRVTCANSGCVHPPCDPHKAKNKKILIIATLLFVFNLTIYSVVHKNIFDLKMFTKVEHVHDDVNNAIGHEEGHHNND